MRYFATRLNGDGTETLIADYLPLSGVSWTKEVSGVNSFTASITPEMMSLKAPDGSHVLLPWSTAIYAEDEEAGVIRHGTLLKSARAKGADLSLTGVGFMAYLDGMPWTDAPQKLYNADPAEVIALIWRTVQKHPGGNIGMSVDTLDVKAAVGTRTYTTNKPPEPTSSTKTTTTTAATITTTTAVKWEYFKDRNVQTTTTTKATKNKKTGKTTTTKTVTTKTAYATKRVVTLVQTYDGTGKLTGSKTTTTTLAASAKVTLLTTSVDNDEPFVLAGYATADLGQTVTDLIAAGSIDYREHHYWDGDKIAHRLELGYPRLGKRLTSLVFDTRVNCLEVPEVEIDADDYASHILVLGAGEGDKMVRGQAEMAAPPRLRRVKTIERKGIGRTATAQTAAQSYLKLYNTFPTDVASLIVKDSDLAPYGSWDVGDEVILRGPTGWGGELNQYVRILSETYDPASLGISLSIIRADRT